MTLVDILDFLPDKIELNNEDPIDKFDTVEWYFFYLAKEADKYILSYRNWLKDEDIVSFSGGLMEVVDKMYNWCKDNGYICP